MPIVARSLPLGAALTLLCSSLLSGQQAKRADAPITVGPNVQISASHGGRPHNEVIAAADPANASRMITCSMVYYEDRHLSAQHCYSSFDNAKSWTPSLIIDSATVAGDPTAAYGFGDTVYVVSLINPLAVPRFSGEYSTHVYRSLDGARTWKQTATYRFIDREWVAVDRTGGKYNGRVYINGQGSVRGMRDERPPGIYLFHSQNGGQTIEGPAVRMNMEGGGAAGVTNVVVLSDGTVAMLFGNTKKGRTQDLTVNNGDNTANATIEFLYSKDGGETFEPSVIVSQFYMDRPRSEGANIGQLAVDATSGPFKDRLYAVWPDARNGRVQVLLSYSADNGKRWSPPVIVNDDRSFAEMEQKRDHILPAVAVNKDGVVAVTWYDRRESADNLGWRVRAAASFDGGETFTASVPVSSQPNAYTASTKWPLEAGGRVDSTQSTVEMFFFVDRFFENGGHTTGLVADAAGVFHPVWVDNRTGVAQMWTAPVTIRGTATRNGSAVLAGMDNISRQLAVELEQNSYDRPTNTLKATLRVKNVSRDTIRAPVKVRVVQMASEVGTPEVVGADNDAAGIGAIWDLSSLIPASGLLPDSITSGRPLTLRLTNVQSMRSGRQYKNRLVTLTTRVYGPAKRSAALSTKD